MAVNSERERERERERCSKRYNKLFAEIYFGINRDAWYSKMNILEVHLDFFYAAKKCVKPRNILVKTFPSTIASILKYQNR